MSTHTLTVKELIDELQVTPGRARLIIAIIDGRVNPDAHVRHAYERTRPGFRHESVLAALDNLIDGSFGVEALCTNGAGWASASAENRVVASYLNTGDTYSPAIFYDHITESYSLLTQGDFVEHAERNAPDYGCKLVLRDSGEGTARRAFEDTDGAEEYCFSCVYIESEGE